MLGSRSISALALGLAAFGALTPAASAQRPGEPMFAGARLGMEKVQLEQLELFGDAGAGCGKLVLPERPRTQVEICSGETDRPAMREGLRYHFLVAPDQESRYRLLHIFAAGTPDDERALTDALFRRYGVPTAVNGQRAPESIDVTGRALTMSWIMGTQRLIYRKPCGGAERVCVEYSDSPYARRLARDAGTVAPQGAGR